ncbi:related to monooxygenase [Fusarium fujikuroi]|nr:related to monooxygenase [Fusarium fujikuroi]
MKVRNSPSAVIIVGAGPSGLILSILLQKRGITSQILEVAEQLDAQPRACHYGGPGKYELERAGVLDKIQAEGFHPGGVTWRYKDGRAVVGIDQKSIPKSSVHRMVVLPLGRVCEILYDEAISAGVGVLFKHRVLPQIGQTDDKAWVDVDADGDVKRFEADYIVGCDGGNSQIRRSLFGDLEFPGWTWNQQIIASNAYYPFEKFGYDDSNFIVHPTDWYMAAKITNDGLWRVTYGDIPGLTKEDYEKRLPMRYKQMLPGTPEPSEYKIENIGPYKMHQRLAKKLRVGRFLLAADAAHLCNPFGGLGLVGGIADVGCLCDALDGLNKGLTDDSILDEYSRVRREKYENIVDPMSTANFKRLWEKEPEETFAKDEFFKRIEKANKDENLMNQLREASMSLAHDITQNFRKPVKV